MPFEAPPDWGIQNPKLIEKTAIASVYRVSSRWGDGALKIFHNGNAKNEAFAPVWLKTMASPHVVPLFADTPGMVLMKWLPGPGLGDVSREGQDGMATRTLAHVAAQLLSKPVTRPDFAPDLAQWVAPIFDCQRPDWMTEKQQKRVGDMQVLCREMLKSCTTPRLLHGDLHHDNIRYDGHNWVAIDPKGVWGDPAYETANAFRNPKGFEGLNQSDRIEHMVACFSEALQIPAERIRAWAAIKCILSSVWAQWDQDIGQTNFTVLEAILQGSDAPNLST
ncbi:MAG: aminoglycoside phosphotransferase family protein [Pseudoruegeria sp.]